MVQTDNMIGRGINSPINYLHMKILRFCLTPIGSWPLKEYGLLGSLKLFLKYFHMVYCVAVPSGAFVYIAKHFYSALFLEKGHIIVTTMMGLVDTSRHYTLTITKKYHKLGTDFLTEFHLFFYKNKSDYAMKTHKQVHMMSHLLTIWLLAQFVFASISFNMLPVYKNYSKGKYQMGIHLQNTTFEQALFIEFPFNVSTNLYGYIVACIFYSILAYLCGTWFCMIDLFLLIMVFHIWGHFKILIHNINNLPKPTKKIEVIFEDGTVLHDKEYTKADLAAVNDQLKECIDYHRNIVEFTNRVSDVYGPMLLIYHMFALTSGCILLLECSEMTTDALIAYLPITVIMFQQLIQLSVVFELVGSESEKLKDVVYHVLWESMDTSTRKVVMFFLMNVQEPIHVKAMGLADVGVTTMLFILKTSLSYFTFLRSTY